MGLKQKIFERKQEFYDILDNMRPDMKNYLLTGGITYDRCIENHLNSWITSRVRGVSASLCLDSSDKDMILLIDEIAIKYFKK